MCGIAGVVVSSKEVFNPQVLRSACRVMCDALSHRGPDGSGSWSSSRAYLGHTRLSIIDVEGGAQPILNEDGSRVLVYNGEVYNYRELRAEIEPRHTFRSRSDSEVVLHFLEENEVGALNQLNGMYAFALWNENDESLLLAVDPLGIKPLYYFQSNTLFLFASELRALISGMHTLGIEVRSNESSLREFLSLGWIPAPNTALDGVCKLLPGERVRVKDGKVHRLGQTPIMPASPRVGDRVESIETALRHAVRRQLHADVPVGILLSGGIDSSLMTALASQEATSIETFSIGFRGKSLEHARADESAFAREVARKFGTKHHEHLLKESDLEAQLLPCLIAMDEPIADAAILPLLTICGFARAHVKVVLSGDGGDELFGGYLRHSTFPFRSLLHRGPSILRHVAGLLGKACDLPPTERRSLERIRRAGVLLRFLNSRQWAEGPFSATLSGRAPSSPMVTAPEDTLFLYDLLGPLAGQMLPKSDRISMRAGVELRVPFLDHEVVSLARSIPLRQKVQGFRSKALLRALLEKYLPAEIATRRKHGFRVPVRSWFQRQGRSELLELFHEARAVVPESVLAQRDIVRLFEEHSAGKRDHSTRLWAIVAWGTWWNSVRERGLKTHENPAGAVGL